MVLAKVSKDTVNLVTADELWQLAEKGKHQELVRGELKEMTPPGGMHGKTALRLGRFLQNFVDSEQLGEVMVENWLSFNRGSRHRS